MKKFISIILAAVMLLGCMSVTAFAEQDSASGYSLFVVIDGLGNESAGTAAVTHVQSETPDYLLPENPKTVKDGYTFKGYACKENGKTYQIGNTIPLADFTEKADGYWIYLTAIFSENEKPGIEYTDVNQYKAELNILYPDDYQGLDNIFATIESTYDPAKDTNVGTVEYNQRTGRTLNALGRFLADFGVAPEGYRSAVTGNIFELDGTYDLDKLPEAAYVGTTLTDDGTNGQRIHEYVITDYLIPIYSYYQVTGAFFDPLYECEIDYFVPFPISDNKNLNAPVSFVGIQTFTDLTMADMTGGIFNPIKLIDPPEYAGYIFEGYGPLSDTEITVPDVPEETPIEEIDMTHRVELWTTDYRFDDLGSGHARLAMKLFYSIDPDYEPGIQQKIIYADNAGTLPLAGAAPADENEYAVGAPFTVMGQGTMVIDGYEFLGWNTKADGSGIMYHEGELAPMPEAGILYAQWKEESAAPEEPTAPDYFITAFSLSKDYNDKYSIGNKTTAVTDTIKFTITPVVDGDPTFANGGVVEISVAEGTGTVNVELPEYDKAGEYWYIIKETAGNTAGVTYDTDFTYYLHVIVDYVDGEFGVRSALIHLTDSTDYDPDNASDKITTISNEYGEGTLTVTQVLTFNGGESDNDSATFVETVTFILPEGKEITGNVTYVIGDNTITITPDDWNDDGTCSVMFTLKNGESVTFTGIPDGTTYTVEQKEDDEVYRLENVEFDVADETGDTVTELVAHGTIGDPADTVIITNAGFTPLDVGVILENGPFIILALGAIAFGAWLVISKRKSVDAE